MNRAERREEERRQRSADARRTIARIASRSAKTTPIPVQRPTIRRSARKTYVSKPVKRTVLGLVTVIACVGLIYLAMVEVDGLLMDLPLWTMTPPSGHSQKISKIEEWPARIKGPVHIKSRYPFQILLPDENVDKNHPKNVDIGPGESALLKGGVYHLTSKEVRNFFWTHPPQQKKWILIVD